MKNSSFSLRYLCQEGLKIITIFATIIGIEILIGSRGITRFFLVLSIFFSINKIISIIKHVENDKNSNLKKVGFTWRCKRKLGIKLSEEDVKRICKDEDNFNLIVIILLGVGVVSQSLLGMVVLLIVFQVVYPDSFGFLDKNFDNYYKFRGECAGIIRIDGSKSSQEIYFVSIVDYDAKQELVVKVNREKMRYFKNGEMIHVVYGKIGRNAVSIY